jgi:diacylglycerol O-acyltransferase / wax synthase
LAGNKFSYMAPSLPVHVADPLRRAELTALATRVAKENHHLLGPTMFPSWLTYLPPALTPAIFRWQSKRMETTMFMNLTISNVPGPRTPGEILGARLTEIYSVGPLVVGSGMNITVWSYVDQLNVSVLTDDRTLDDPHEATDAFVRSFHQLRTAAGLPAEPTSVEETLPLAEAGGR